MPRVSAAGQYGSVGKSGTAETTTVTTARRLTKGLLFPPDPLWIRRRGISHLAVRHTRPVPSSQLPGLRRRRRCSCCPPVPFGHIEQRDQVR
jgi:hypothetical protein